MVYCAHSGGITLCGNTKSNFYAISHHKEAKEPSAGAFLLNEEMPKGHILNLCPNLLLTGAIHFVSISFVTSRNISQSLAK